MLKRVQIQKVIDFDKNGNIYWEVNKMFSLKDHKNHLLRGSK